MMKKIGTPVKQTSTYNPEKEETILYCPKCSKKTVSKMTKKAFIGKEKLICVCGYQF